MIRDATTRLIVTFMAIGLASWVAFWWGLSLLPTAFAPRMFGMLIRTASASSAISGWRSPTSARSCSC